MTWRMITGECVEVMAAMPEASVDAIVTDPPYGLHFMGKTWDQFGGPTGARHTGVDGSTEAGGAMHAGRYDLRLSGLRAFQAEAEAWGTAMLRVLKPGGHLLMFGGTRTYHRLVTGLEDAGFEIRDCLAWLYGSGFPKSLDVSKAIDKMDATTERDARAKRSQAWLREHVTPQQVNDATGTEMGHHLTTHPTQPFIPTPTMLDQLRPLLPSVPDWLETLVTDRAVESANFAARQVTGLREGSTMPGFARIANGKPTSWNETKPHTSDAETWQGWGTALKPAHEPIVLARKPLTGTVAQNVLEHGTGALNIDGCRIDYANEADRPTQEEWNRAGSSGAAGANGFAGQFSQGMKDAYAEGKIPVPSGRWPANIALDETAAAMLDEQSGEHPGAVSNGSKGTTGSHGIYNEGWGMVPQKPGRGDTGGASRFFYTAKTSSAERNRGLEHMERQPRYKAGGVGGTGGKRDVEAAVNAPPAANNHPTVKPVELMQWLCRLITPPHGVVLDPFAGSGSTGIAALREGFGFVGIEREAEYVGIARDRIIGDAPLFNVEAEIEA